MGLFEGFCVACEWHGSLDATGLCDDCGAQLERDLIRRRDWRYCHSVVDMGDAAREKLRRDVIRQHGSALELLLDDVPSKRGRKRSKRRNS